MTLHIQITDLKVYMIQLDNKFSVTYSQETREEKQDEIWPL